MHAACNASCRHADACKETHATEVAGKQKQKQMEMEIEMEKEKQTTKVKVVELQRGR